MGECNYYLQARFRSVQEAEQGRERLEQLLAEGQRAYDYWQESRSLDNRRAPSSEMFWGYFRTAFPRVTAYLEDLAGIDDWNNGLAGTLGCFQDPIDEQRVRIKRVNAVLQVILYNIWHFSRLDLLERVVVEDFRAIKVNTASEEELEDETEFDSEDKRFDEVFDPFEFIPV